MTQHLVSLPARTQPCPSCGALTLLAVTGGSTVRTGSQPLSPGEEIAAVLAGGCSYDVLVYGLPRRVWLEWRSVTRIRAGRQYAVVATHECGLLITGTSNRYLADIAIPAGEPLPDYPPF